MYNLFHRYGFNIPYIHLNLPNEEALHTWVFLQIDSKSRVKLGCDNTIVEKNLSAGNLE